MPDTFQGYHKFRRDDGTEYGSFEVFYYDSDPDPDFFPKRGWYWWVCREDFLPESDPSACFPTAEGAYLDALEGDNMDVDSAVPEMGIFDDYEGMDSGIDTSVDGLPNHGDWAIPSVDTALEEGTRYERAFGDGNDIGG